LPWYEQFFAGRPSFLPNDIEAVWEVAEHRYIYIVRQLADVTTSTAAVAQAAPRSGRAGEPNVLS